ncbi:hypothetical protein JCM10207_001578 [Rhodosporidiobolus poonsookiae]
MDTPTGPLSPIHTPALAQLEPEELPALSNLDLNSLTEHSGGHFGHHQHHQPPHLYHHPHSHPSSHPHSINNTPPRAFSSHSLPLSPSSPITDPDSGDHDPHAPHTGDESYFPSAPSPYDFLPHPPRNPGDLPPEIIALIIHHLFYGYLPYPAPFPQPDPYLRLLPPQTHLFFPEPARLAPPPDAQAKETLAALALVDKTWNAEATRALWRRVSFGMPRAFESVLRTIEEYSGGRRVRRPLGSDLRSPGASVDEGSGLGRSLGLSFGSVEVDASGKKERGEYVERWRREGSEGIAVADVLGEPVNIDGGQSLSSAFSSLPQATLPRVNPRESPLLFTRSLSFARFRTAGMKRSIRSGKEERFVTPQRLLALLKGTRYPKRGLKFPVEKEEDEGYGGVGFTGFGAQGYGADSETETETESESETPGGTFGGWGRPTKKKMLGQLCQVGFSEYMDSAITFSVLQELLFRGGYLAEYEEPDEPSFLPDFDSSASSDADGGTPYMGASAILSPNEQPFHYRHLQSSHSRSPDDGRRRSLSITSAITEVDEPASAEGSGTRTPVDGGMTPEQEHPASFGARDPAAEDTEMGDGARTPIYRSRPGYRRRASGSAFAAPQPDVEHDLVRAAQQLAERQHERERERGVDDSSSSRERESGYFSADSDLGAQDDLDDLHLDADAEDDEPVRGRARLARQGTIRASSGAGLAVHTGGGGGGGGSGLPSPFEGPGGELGSGRGRSRFPRGHPLAGVPLSRSSSLPAPAPFPSPSHGHGHGHAHAHNHAHPHASQSRHRFGAGGSPPRAASERSSSVPASVSGRWAEPVPKRVVQVLEGSVEVQPVRALDLCGCVSRVFVAALDEFVGLYKLGPPALKSQQMAQEDAQMEDGDEDDDEFAGRRTPSVRSIRMGLAEERVLNRTFFPHLRRLGLASSLLPSHLLTAFVLSFPYLTHLDLASTLTSPMLLKGLALAGQQGIGGRPMRLKALSLARCRLITGPALLGLFCGDCPPMTTMAGISDDDTESWGAGEVVSELTDLSLFGDATYPCPLEGPELRLVLTVSPAFRSGLLHTVDLGSAPMTDQLLREAFPPQPNLIELGLASCRAITMQAVAAFLVERAPAVEVLDLSFSCPSNVGQGISSRRRTTIGQPTISIMELHAVLLAECASVESSSSNPEEAQLLLALRQTNLRVVELDEKSLELIQGGAGDWKPIPGKGRRGWYVDTATSSRLPPSDPSHPPYPRPRQLVHLSKDDTKRQALLKVVSQHSAATFENVGWHSRKMEVLRGFGLLGGHHEGLYGFHAYA